MYRLKLSYHYHTILPVIYALILCAGITACEKDDKISKAPHVVMVPATDTLPAVIAENTLLTNTHTWFIKDWVYVTNEATLTIEPGAIIKIIRKKDTNGGLLITRGAKIIARGLPDWPVLFQLDRPTRGPVRADQRAQRPSAQKPRHVRHRDRPADLALGPQQHLALASRRLSSLHSVDDLLKRE